MPMAIPIIAPMIASALGSAILPSIAGSTLLGVGTSTLGGMLGGALAGGLTNENDPLLGAVLGGVGGGLGGPGLAEGAGSLLSGGAEALGLGGAELGADALAGGAGSLATGAGDVAAGAASAASAATPALSAAEIAAPTGATEAFAPLESSALSGLDATAAGGGELLNSGSAAGQIGALGEAPVGGALGAGAGTVDAYGLGAASATPANTFLNALDDPSLANIFNAIETNKDILMPGVGLAATAFQDSTLPGEGELADLAAQMKRDGELNASYAKSGQLPVGIEGSLRSSSEAAKAAVRSMFASRGMSGSSSEVQTLANIDQTRAEQGANIAMKLLSQGVQQSQISSRLYDVILRNALAKDQALGGSIARFATALAA